MRRFVVAFALCLPLSADITDADLIARALAFAKSSKDGAQIKEPMYQHCRERALSFSQSPPPTGKSENLNDVKVVRGKTIVVTFSHLGSAYDGVNCRVTVELNANGIPVRTSTQQLKSPI